MNSIFLMLVHRVCINNKAVENKSQSSSFKLDYTLSFDEYVDLANDIIAYAEAEGTISLNVLMLYLFICDKLLPPLISKCSLDQLLTDLEQAFIRDHVYRYTNLQLKQLSKCYSERLENTRVVTADKLEMSIDYASSLVKYIYSLYMMEQFSSKITFESDEDQEEIIENGRINIIDFVSPFIITLASITVNESTSHEKQKDLADLENFFISLTNIKPELTDQLYVMLDKVFQKAKVDEIVEKYMSAAIQVNDLSQDLLNIIDLWASKKTDLKRRVKKLIGGKFKLVYDKNKTDTIEKLKAIKEFIVDDFNSFLNCCCTQRKTGKFDASLHEYIMNQIHPSKERTSRRSRATAPRSHTHFHTSTATATHTSTNTHTPIIEEVDELPNTSNTPG